MFKHFDYLQNTFHLEILIKIQILIVFMFKHKLTKITNNIPNIQHKI